MIVTIKLWPTLTETNKEKESYKCSGNVLKSYLADNFDKLPRIGEILARNPIGNCWYYDACVVLDANSLIYGN